MEVCSNTAIHNNSAVYKFPLVKPVCENKYNCWIQFKAPEDTFSIMTGNNIIFDLGNTENYLSNEYFLIPFNANDTNQIIISAYDNNQNIKFPEVLCIKFGEFEKLRWRNSFSWFLTTGSNLFSSYFLLVISIFLLFSFWFRKSGLGLSLLVYSVVSCIYLLSFSEYPRAIFDPVLATGGFHFPIRLIQDLSLVFVFYNFYQKYDSFNIIKRLSWIYIIVILIYLLLLLIGIKDYKYYARVIIIMAPLVAAPMAIGTWFAFKLKDSTERKVLIPLSILLLIFQINDLFVFWGLIDSYFMVRIYIPFIVGMALFLYFRRMHDEALQIKTSNERQKIFKEFIHDVKSPLAVLRIFFAGQIETDERKVIIQSALDRIEGMVTQIDSPHKEELKQKIPLVATLTEIIKQKKVEYPDFNFRLNSIQEVYTFAHKIKLQRTFSNIINNAYESYEANLKKLDVDFIIKDDDVRVRFTDEGRGIPTSVYRKIFTETITTKENGKGIGLSSAIEYIRNIGGDLCLISKEDIGTTVEIKLKTVPGNFDFNDEFFYSPASKDDLNSLDFILIDDDKYIRLSWEYFARNSKKEILTFSNVESFIEVADKIRKDCPIYLDLNINGEKTIKYIDTIYEKGFENIILATGEDFEDDILPDHVQSLSGKLPPLQ